MRPEETTILVPSCWAYRDCWQPFMQLMEKFWPKRKFLTVLVTDKMDEDMWDGDSVINHYGDFGWCGNLARALKEEMAGGTKQFILLQEDFFLSAEVDSDFIEYCLGLMGKEGLINAIRLYPCPGPDSVSNLDDSGRLGLVSKNAPYSVSCQAAIWRANYLLMLAERYNTPQEFELSGSLHEPDIFGCTLALKRESHPWPLQYICTAIVKGKWQKGALEHCKKFGIDVDTSLRGIE